MLRAANKGIAMRYTDVAIVGGGLAGSTAAAMLGRAGIAAILVDPHTVYPPDLRCEKLGGAQLGLLRKTGLAEAVLRVATHDGQVWISRFGYLVDIRPSDQYGILYDTLVNTMRGEVLFSVEIMHAKATSISTSRERQRLVLSDGEVISARLIVLANGLNIGLRHLIGIERKITSECHSVTLAFDVAPVGRPAFAFPALTYYPERSADRMAYLTLFPVGDVMRANMMVYRRMDDPWLRRFREQPEATMRAMMPGLRWMSGDFQVLGPIRIRPADLYVTEGHRQAGIVLIGDAFATSCPAAGTGTDKVFTDVERLCNVHIPNWLASDGMGAEKIAAFYDDPVKTGCDAWSTAKAYHLRSLTIDNGLQWRARRWARFLLRLGQGALRHLREAAGARPAAAEKLAAPEKPTTGPGQRRVA
jgi:2-polyprenyl-6-methoxyphenol hydroxylase-like FAD-dependent oxidoreductase